MKRAALLLTGACLLLVLLLAGSFLLERLRPNKEVQVPLAPEKQTAETPPIPQSGLNLNTATKTDLLRLPGIGPHLASQIVLAREKQPFHFLEDLRVVPGIGETRLSALLGLAYVPLPPEISPTPLP